MGLGVLQWIKPWTTTNNSKTAVVGYYGTSLMASTLRKWIAELASQVDPVRKASVQQKGDNGMVKKTISKTSQKKSVWETQDLLVIYACPNHHQNFGDPMEFMHFSPIYNVACIWTFSLRPHGILPPRSGGPALKSSAAYTKTFASWVLRQHMVPAARLVGFGSG